MINGISHILGHDMNISYKRTLYSYLYNALVILTRNTRLTVLNNVFIIITAYMKTIYKIYRNTTIILCTKYATVFWEFVIVELLGLFPTGLKLILTNLLSH